MMAEAKSDPKMAAFAALEAARRSARIAFRLDLGRLCHPHCPLPLDHYKTRIAYVYLGLIAILYFGLLPLELSRWPFWSVLGGFTLVYWVGVRPFAERWVRTRIVDYLMDDPARLDTIWKYGGVSLVASDGTTVSAPKDDWRRFVMSASADRQT
jgi:hypothetical protein